MRLADVRKLLQKEGRVLHSFLVIESNFTTKAGLLACIEVVEQEGDPPLELFLHTKEDADALIKKNLDAQTWVELQRGALSPEANRALSDQLRDLPMPDVNQLGPSKRLLDSATQALPRKRFP